MNAPSRREFLQEVGRGMVVAGMGAALASDFGLAPLWANEESSARLTFGSLEPLVALMQETEPDKLLPLVVEKLKAGTTLQQITAAAALANARTFGGEDYRGFHAFMALAPAYHMAAELPTERQALPVLKVLYRNTSLIQSGGGADQEALHPLPAADIADASPEAVRAAINQGDGARAEQLLAQIASRSPEDAFQAALLGVEDNHDVHTVVLPWRAWATLDFTGREHALTLLRQSVRKCAAQAKPHDSEWMARLEKRRQIVPKLLEQYKLPRKFAKNRVAEDAWIDKLAQTIFRSTEEEAAAAVAVALAEGFSPQAIGEAISLASNLLVLRQAADAGRYGTRTHGDSPGVHASDATNAWRNIIQVCNARHAAAGLMLAAANVANSSGWMREEEGTLVDEPFPHAEQVEGIKQQESADLLKQLAGAVRERDQLTACAIVERYGQLQHDARGVFQTLLEFAISEDGRLHGEKYYRTVSEEFAATRPAFRWRQLTALARVTASSYGLDAKDRPAGRAPGYEAARRLLEG